MRYTDPSGHRPCDGVYGCQNEQVSHKVGKSDKWREDKGYAPIPTQCTSCHAIPESTPTPAALLPTWTPTPPCPQGPSNCTLKQTATPTAQSNCPSGQTCMGQQPLTNTPVGTPTPFLRDVVTNPTFQSGILKLAPSNPIEPDLEMPEGHFINMNQLWEDMFRIAPPYLGHPAQNIPLTTWPIIIIFSLMKGPAPIFIIPQDPFNKIVT